MFTINVGIVHEDDTVIAEATSIVSFADPGPEAMIKF